MPTASEVVGHCWSIQLPVDRHYAPLRHVGAMEFARLFDKARAAFVEGLRRRMATPHRFDDQVIARIATDFRAEVPWREQLEIQAVVSRVGRSSYDVDLTVMHDGAVAVFCRTVNVWTDGRRPTPLTPEAVMLLNSFT